MKDKLVCHNGYAQRERERERREGKVRKKNIRSEEQNAIKVWKLMNGRAKRFGTHFVVIGSHLAFLNSIKAISDRTE